MSRPREKWWPMLGAVLYGPAIVHGVMDGWMWWTFAVLLGLGPFGFVAREGSDALNRPSQNVKKT